MAEVVPLPTKDQVHQNARKWGAAWRAGWTGVPSTLLQRQQALGLDPLDLNILLQLFDHWWQYERLPWPSKATIAERVGCSPRTVQRRITEMEREGLLTREKRIGQTTVYHFDGLIKAVNKFAEEVLEERRERAERRRERARRKRPRSRK